jgi:hypothetical protein
MKYLCLVYGEEKALDALSEGEMAVLVEESLAYDDVLRRSGHYIESAALQQVNAAKTVRVRDHKTAITDGPFAETKEQLLGFILIDAKDLDDAVEVAAKIPSAAIGSIEVRPALDLEPLRTRPAG